MSTEAAGEQSRRRVFLDFYDGALPYVYGYLMARTRDRGVAEEITSEVFLASFDRARRDPGTPLTAPWAVGIARYKLIDHWRRQGRAERGLRALIDDNTLAGQLDDWDARIDSMKAQDTLGRLSSTHRIALTLRYVDDLPVPEVAGLLGRTVHATEALLVRARASFRRTYEDSEDPDA